MRRVSRYHGHRASETGVALIMVLIVLGTLAVIGTPFVVSMMIHDRASRTFAGDVAAREAARAARNHAIASLERTAYPSEYALEAAELAKEEESGSSYRSRRRSVLGGRDRDDRAHRRRGGRGQRIGEEDEDDGPKLPEWLTESERGPSPRSYDATSEIASRLPSRLELPESAPPDPVALEGDGRTVELRDPRGITASAEVADEQGKINLNTAPPNLIASIFGVSQLAVPFRLQDTKMFLDDVSRFRGDADESTIDGAVVLVDPGSGTVEAVTYRKVDGDALHGCFRGALFSLPLVKEFPAESFVYDLRGWKIAYHRLWSERLGGFHPEKLGVFRSVEAIRDISRWQIASLFLNRFRGQGLDREFLREAGIDRKKLEQYGIDPLIFLGEDKELSPERRREYEIAVAKLKRLRVNSRLLRAIEAQRGPEVIVEMASRLEGAGREEVQRVSRQMAEVLQADRRRSLRLDRRYLAHLLTDLAESYETEGIETVLPEELERHRDAFTVHSRVAARWSEAQAILGDVSVADASWDIPVPRATEFNRGTIVRLRRHEAGGRAEYNIASSGGRNSLHLAYPPLGSYSAYEGTVEAYQRHPVNANTASRRVLRAVFTGVTFGGGQPPDVVTPYEADQLAERVMGARPLRSHEDFFDLLEKAVKAKVIDEEDLEPLYVNAVDPTNYLLRVSTTGFTYATGDVYTIESRGVLRSPSAREVSQAQFREIVDVSPPGVLRTGLITQRDFSEGIYRLPPMIGGSFPERHHDHLLSFPGSRSHLVMTRPLLLHGKERIEPLGDRGSLRLFPSETPRLPNQHFPVEHFEATYEGLDLFPGATYQVDIGLQGGATPRPGNVLQGRSQRLDLIMVPGGIEFWFRMRTYPEARSEDGLLKLLEAGRDPERNKIALLYEPGRGRIVFRLYDSSLADPSVITNERTGQYLQIEAFRQLFLHTWYHFRVAWDGVFGGGAQLFIDGLPAGKDNLSTELVSSIPATSQIASISVRDASGFPLEGVVKIGGELFEYKRTGTTTLQVRRQEPSTWRVLTHLDEDQRGTGLPGAGGETGGRGGTGGTAGGQTAGAQVPGGAGQAQVMRAPWNNRGSTPSSHQAGERVSVWGYSLEIRRKVQDNRPNRPRNLPSEYQLPDGDARQIVWGPGGLRLADPLPAWSFPPEVEPAIYHYISFRALQEQTEGPAGGAGPGGQIPEPGGYVVPFFRKYVPPLPGCPIIIRDNVPLGTRLFAAKLQNYGRDASDYFQTRGIARVLVEEPSPTAESPNRVVLRAKYFLYRKVALPEHYIQAQMADICNVEAGNVQRMGLQLEREWVRGGRAPGRRPQGGGAGDVQLWEGGEVLQLSLLANGPVERLYPPTGVLEVEGVPTPWELATGRRDLSGQDLFQSHPDDRVEWFRYVEVFENLFIGRLRGPGSSNFRGYPARELHLKKQLDHRGGESLRLVMELSQGGAGHGDYVTITSSDPQKFEPAVRRIYNVSERDDGRFFVSLVEVDDRGRALPNSPGAYQNVYFRADNPRLVKFPSWGLPEVDAVGELTLFGNARVAPSTRSRSRVPLPRSRRDREEDGTGITVDEIRPMEREPGNRPDPTLGPQVRFVLVPLEGGSVRRDANAGLSGAIRAERSISRQNPLEVLVVSVSTERGIPTLFGEGVAGLEDGVLRINGELFYFEDPREGASVAARATLHPSQGGAFQGLTAGPGQITEPQPVPDPQNPQPVQNQGSIGGERGLLSRTVDFSFINSAGGGFEPRGFARIEANDPEHRSFYEVFYYEGYGGGRFTNCLRGQFQTPIVDVRDAAGPQWGSRIANVTKRLRLIGRSLLGTEPQTHALGAPVTLVPYLTMSPIVGPLTDTGLPVKDASRFVSSGGYVLVDPGIHGRPWELLPHLGPQGDGMLGRPRDERGKGCLRGAFGTSELPVAPGMFAYEMPFRHYDRYQPETESESFAYHQKSFRIPGAYWRALDWEEREWPGGRDRLVDIVVVARLDGAPGWDVEPTNERGGLYLFEKTESALGSREDEAFEIGQYADELQLRVYFRYRKGAYRRLQEDTYNDDWKETPILDSLTLEYEKDGTVLRHEELPF